MSYYLYTEAYTYFKKVKGMSFRKLINTILYEERS